MAAEADRSSSVIDPTLAALIERLKPRAKSLIVTIFGDAILPAGGAVWLGDLIRLAASLDLAERTVRTAVWRLVQDGTLEAEQIGRRSLYRLTSIGRRRFETAQKRIYTAPSTTWDGRWHLVITPPSIERPSRESLERELGWLGYAAIAPGVLAHPHGDAEACQGVLAAEGLDGSVVTMTAETLSGAGAQREIVGHAWPLEEIAARYRELLDAFDPMANASIDNDEMAFGVRVLLIHAYRRALLIDPDLPTDLLPSDWPGAAAAGLTAALYTRLAVAAQRHVSTLCGDMSKADADLSERFSRI